ncbi:MAG TPA: ABC transporter permease [Alphaproteobacteria bacterium]|nr:ABC transporter permease [Alphaproteobacteria bacterium]
MNFTLMAESFAQLIWGVPTTLGLTVLSLALGIVCATGMALARLSANPFLSGFARAYIFAFRGTPLLVQIYLIYNGLADFEAIRNSILWPVLREPFWCAILALTLNTTAYTAEIIRGGIQSVPWGQIEAAKACGMSRFLIFRRITVPITIRQALPAYGNEIILMVKATSLASLITLADITGIAERIISRTFSPIEVFVVAGGMYLLINFAATRLVRTAEWRLTPYLRPRI